MPRGCPGVEDSHHHEDSHRAQVLQGGRRCGEREAAVCIHDRGRRADDGIERHFAVAGTRTSRAPMCV